MNFYVQVPVYFHAKEHTPSLPWYNIKWKTLGVVGASDPETALSIAKEQYPEYSNPVISRTDDGICQTSRDRADPRNHRRSGSHLRRTPRLH